MIHMWALWALLFYKGCRSLSWWELPKSSSGFGPFALSSTVQKAPSLWLSPQDSLRLQPELILKIARTESEDHFIEMLGQQ